MSIPTGWAPDVCIQEDGTIVRYRHEIRIDLGPWHSPKPCDHMLEWCLEHVGEHNKLWRVYRVDFGSSLIMQFVHA